MIKKIILFSLSCFLIIPLFLTACNDTETTPTPVTTPTAAATSPTATPEAHWWDDLGEPEYGGTLNLHVTSDPSSFDPYNSMLNGCEWFDQMGGFDRTLSSDVCAYNTNYYPPEAYISPLSESWETTDFLTFTFHIRQGIRWWDVEPLNGRELTADDIVYNYNRIMGNGSGFTQPSPFFLKTGWLDLESITAPDKYTVVFKFKQPSVQNLLTILEQTSCNHISAAEEAVEQWGQPAPPDWSQTVGTGPFILTDYVSGASYTLTRNPNYWKYDDRWPDNRLPYVDEVKYLIIQDYSTAQAALRSGRLDVVGGTTEDIAWQQAETLKKSNPEILQVTVPTPANGLQLRVDLEPFSDIRVRTAMQMAMDLPTIAKTYYNDIDWKPWGTAGPEVREVNNPYDTWPKDLQEEYSFNAEGAKALLAEAGFPNGFETTCLVASNQDTQLLQVMQAYLKDIGIDVAIQVEDAVTQRTLTASNQYEMLFFPMGMAENKPVIRLAGNLYTGYTNNFPRVADPEYDKLYDQWVKSTSWDEANSLGKEIDMYVIKGHYRVTLMPFYTYLAYQPWVGGFNGEAGNQKQYHTAYYWVKSDVKK